MTSTGEHKAALDRFLADNPELEQLSARLATFNVFRALRFAGEQGSTNRLSANGY